MPVKQIARKFHTLDLALSTGGLYVGGLIDIGYGPQRHGEGTRYYKDRETIAYEGSYKYGRWDGYGKRFAADGRLIYEGYFYNDLYHGRGTLYGDNGEYYEGEWVDGLKDGPGTYVKQDGEKYMGNWKKGKYHGKGELHNKEGTLIFKGTHKYGIRVGECYFLDEYNGEVFDGNHIDGILHGQAKYVDSHGNSYEGSWNMGTREGYGKSVNRDGSKYVGQWKSDEKNGDGEDIDKDGYNLKGTFVNGYLENYGILYYPNKAIAYEGEFKKSKFHGLGEIFRGDGILVYSGTFKNGKYDGYGNCYMANNGYYYGYWKNGLRHTGNSELITVEEEEEEGEEEDDGDKFKTGEFRDEHGWVYSGEWVNDKRHGKGKLYDQHGALVYDGEFVNNIVNGEGHHHYTSVMMRGSDFKGTFINGKKEGDGILTYKDGTVLYKGTYVHDTWHGEGEWQDLYGTWYKGTFVLGKRTGSGEVQLSNGHFYKGDFLDGKYHGKGVLVKRKVVCDGYFKNGEYLESNDEREERLKLEEKERKRRELKKNAIAEQMRRRDAALKRRADAKAKAMSKLSNWGDDNDDMEDINEANERIMAEEQEKQRLLKIEEDRKKKEEEAKRAAETPEEEILPSLAKQKRLDILNKRGSRALNRKKIPRKHGKGVSETMEMKKIERKSMLQLPKLNSP